MPCPENNLPLAARRFCIDALNLAYWCGREPSLRVPLALMAQLLGEGHRVRLYFDASARYRFDNEWPIYEQLVRQPQHCIEVAAGRTADGLLLRDARATGASLISRDHFADFRRRYRKLIDDPTRRFGGWVEQGQLCVPGLMLKVPLPATALEAWQALAPLLATSVVPPSEAGKPRLPALLAVVLIGTALSSTPTSADAWIPIVVRPAHHERNLQLAVRPEPVERFSSMTLNSISATTPPSIEEVRFNTQPLIKARLRLPDSLRDMIVTQIAPTADDPARFAVTLRFKAKAPFGHVTEHTARFLMKRSTSGRVWMVTAD